LRVSAPLGLGRGIPTRQDDPYRPLFRGVRPDLESAARTARCCAGVASVGF
jgi:hypothetical protein